jgi:hypothetical protein
LNTDVNELSRMVKLFASIKLDQLTKRVSHFTLVADAVSLMPNFLLQFTGRCGNSATELQDANFEVYLNLWSIIPA